MPMELPGRSYMIFTNPLEIELFDENLLMVFVKKADWEEREGSCCYIVRKPIDSYTNFKVHFYRLKQRHNKKITAFHELETPYPPKIQYRTLTKPE